jgi:hypothetical protein
MGRGSATLTGSDAVSLLGARPNLRYEGPGSDVGKQPITFTQVGVLDDFGNNALLVSPASSLDIDLPTIQVRGGKVAYPMCLSKSTAKFDEAIWKRLVRHGHAADGQKTVDALWRDGIGIHALGRGLKKDDRPLSREELREELREVIHRLRLPIVEARLARSRQEVRKAVNDLLNHAQKIEETAASADRWALADGVPLVPEVGSVSGWSDLELSRLVHLLQAAPEHDELLPNPKRKGHFGRELAVFVADGDPLRLKKLQGGDGFAVRAAIRTLQHRGVPIVGNPQQGYWMARNADEVHAWQQALRSRAAAERERAEELNYAGILFFPEAEHEQKARAAWSNQLRTSKRSPRAIRKAKAQADYQERRRLHSPIQKAKEETERWLDEHRSEYEKAIWKVGHNHGATAADKKLVATFQEARGFARYNKKRKRVSPGQQPRPWELPATGETRPAATAPTTKASSASETVPPVPW